MHKHALVGNDVRKYCKKNYMEMLNQRYVSDAVFEAKKVIRDNAVFGGKRVWKEFASGKISKKKWNFIRNSQLYSRGDSSAFRGGNPNIRIIGNRIYINDPSKYGVWIVGKLWLQESFPSNCYDVRLEARGDTFKVIVSYKYASKIITDIKKGAIGVDSNPDGVALVNLDFSGNLLKHIYIRDSSIQFSKKEKRTNSIYEIAKKVVDFALLYKKPIVVEKLNFGKKKKSKKFNRMANNFAWRRMLNAIKSRAHRFGVEVIEVPAAYTSIVGKLKYMTMYSISIHTAAAMIIGRMGLGIKDKVVVSISELKDLVTLEARSESVALKRKSFLWLKSKFRICQKQPTLTASCLVPTNNGHKALVSLEDEKVIEPYNQSDSCQEGNLFGEGIERVSKGDLPLADFKYVTQLR
jgi:IS605 OrfB family transposase